MNESLGTRLPTDLFELIRSGRRDELREASARVANQRIPFDRIRFRAPYRRPGRILGIGLNYREHAAQLEAVFPKEEPASFLRPATTIIDPGEPIQLPPGVERVTAEAELAIVVGRGCRDLSLEEAGDAIFGYTAVLDMTAESILRKNPRFLTRSKSFDTFFSFGPWIVTPDEVPDLAGVRVSTVRNGEVAASNVVRNMQFTPHFLLAFHTRSTTWEAGDILCTGTPAAVPIEEGDRVQAVVEGIGVLENRVAGPGGAGSGGTLS